MTAFATEEAKVTVHSSLLLLLGQLAFLSKFGREVGVVSVGRASGWLSRVVVVVVVVVGASVAFVRAGVVFPVIWWAVGLHGFVRFVGFTGTGSILAADL